MSFRIDKDNIDYLLVYKLNSKKKKLIKALYFSNGVVTSKVKELLKQIKW